MAIMQVTNINTGEHNDTVGSFLFFKLVLIPVHNLHTFPCKRQITIVAMTVLWTPN